MNSHAVAPLTTTPIAATTMIVSPCVTCGDAAAHRLPGERSHRDQQQQRIGERGQDRGPRSRRCGAHRADAAGQRAGPGEHEAGHVAEVVAGIGQQRERIDLPAEQGLDGDVDEVQCDADRESAIVAGGPVGVAARAVPAGARGPS